MPGSSEDREDTTDVEETMEDLIAATESTLADLSQEYDKGPTPAFSAESEAESENDRNPSNGNSKSSSPEPTRDNSDSPEITVAVAVNPAADYVKVQISEDPKHHEKCCPYSEFILGRQNIITHEEAENAFHELKIPINKTKKASNNKNTDTEPIFIKGYTLAEYKEKLKEVKENASAKDLQFIQDKMKSSVIAWYILSCWSEFESYKVEFEKQCVCPKAKVLKQLEGNEPVTVKEIQIPPSIPLSAKKERKNQPIVSDPDYSPEKKNKKRSIVAEDTFTSFASVTKKIKLTRAQQDIVLRCGIDLSESESEDESQPELLQTEATAVTETEPTCAENGDADAIPIPNLGEKDKTTAILTLPMEVDAQG